MSFVIQGAMTPMPSTPETDSQNETEPITYGVNAVQSRTARQSARSVSPRRPNSLPLQNSLKRNLKNEVRKWEFLKNSAQEA